MYHKRCLKLIIPILFVVKRFFQGYFHTVDYFKFVINNRVHIVFTSFYKKIYYRFNFITWVHFT